jgi:hypothetical protein
MVTLRQSAVLRGVTGEGRHEPWFEWLRWAGIPITTLADFIAGRAESQDTGSSSSSSAASRLISDMMRCELAWISTWAMTVSRPTVVTGPTNQLRVDSETTGVGSRLSVDSTSS